MVDQHSGGQLVQVSMHCTTGGSLESLSFSPSSLPAMQTVIFLSQLLARPGPRPGTWGRWAGTPRTSWSHRSILLSHTCMSYAGMGYIWIPFYWVFKPRLLISIHFTLYTKRLRSILKSEHSFMPWSIHAKYLKMLQWGSLQGQGHH